METRLREIETAQKINEEALWKMDREYVDLREAFEALQTAQAALANRQALIANILPSFEGKLQEWVKIQRKHRNRRRG
jgi:hypothetical protein